MTDQQTNTEPARDHVTYDDDKAINPNHYQGRGGKQCYDVIKDILGANTLIHFYKANVIKYLYRFDTKNGLQDIRKAKWYFTEYSKLYQKSLGAASSASILDDSVSLDSILTPFVDDKTACYALKAIILLSIGDNRKSNEFIGTCIDKLEELWSAVEQEQNK